MHVQGSLGPFCFRFGLGIWSLSGFSYQPRPSYTKQGDHTCFTGTLRVALLWYWNLTKTHSSQGREGPLFRETPSESQPFTKCLGWPYTESCCLKRHPKGAVSHIYPGCHLRFFDAEAVSILGPSGLATVKAGFCLSTWPTCGHGSKPRTPSEHPTPH